MHRIAVFVPDTVRPFELSIFCEVFGVDRTEHGVPPFELLIAAEDPSRPIPTLAGMTITPTGGLDLLADADVVAAAPALEPQTDVSPPVREALHAAYARGARVMSVCTGAFTLAAAGLLDDRRVVTHWMYAELLQERFPKAHVDATVLYVDDDPIFTSAGTAAGLDLCLHMVRKDHGAAAANAIARRMVFAPYRSGGQAQFVENSVPDAQREDNIHELLSWAQRNLHQDLSIDVLARRSFLSRRSLARRFRAATGTTPYAWVVEQRLRLAQRLLQERADLSVQDVAVHAGFSSAGMLRQHFGRRYGISPSEYRIRYRRRGDTGGESGDGAADAPRWHESGARGPESVFSMH